MPRQLTQRHYDEIENQLAQVRAALALSGVVSNTSWQQAAWFVDPANSTGVASDNNSGLTALTPVRTWNGGVIARLGTFTPRIRQNTTITFLSSHVDNTDPVIFNPFIENGAQILITAALPAPAATGVLGVVVAKARATNTLLSAVTVPGSVVGRLIVNTTRANSRAFVYQLLGAPSVTISQPFAPLAALPAGALAENNAWATGDAVQVFDLFNINIAEVRPTMVDLGAASNTALAITNLTIFDPRGVAAGDPCFVGPFVQIAECNATRSIAFSTESASIGAIVLNANSTAVNVAFQGGAQGGPTGAIVIGSLFPIMGLQLLGGFLLANAQLSGARLDGDIIIGTNAASGATASSVSNGALGSVATDTSALLAVYGSWCNARGGSPYGVTAIWGGGTLNVAGSCRLFYPAGAGGAVATFLLTPRMQLNGANAGHSCVDGAPDVLNSIASITAANLDAAAGIAGYGGRAFTPGGASIVNLLP